jgi:1-pyrroline-5-carboxylate dehydrogenase
MLKARSFSSLGSFATVDPHTMSAEKPHTCFNLVNGSWGLPETGGTSPMVDPLNGESFMNVADTKSSDLAPFIAGLKSVPKHGLHNPFKNNERYLMYGDISHKAAAMMREKEVEDFFTRLIQRVAPKSDAQVRH